MATITNTISLGRIQTTLPKKLYFGSETPDCPKETKLETVKEDPSHSQHFYFCTRGDNKNEGVLATYDLSYIIEKSLTKEVNSGFRYKESPLPHFVNGAEYPCWVKDEMMFILEKDSGPCESTYIFRRKSDPCIVLSCFQDEVASPIIIKEYQATGDTRNQRFTLQNTPPS